MVSIVTDARDLPPDMILLPGGREMRLSDFWQEYGDDLRLFKDAKIAVATPGLHVPSEMNRAMEAAVGLILTSIVGVVLRRRPSMAAMVAPMVGAVLSKDVVDWIDHHIEHGRIVRVYTIGELFFRDQPQPEFASAR